MSIQTLPPSWQPAQWPLMPVWIIAVVGTGLANFVPGAETVAFAGTNADGVEARWQVSQAAVTGMCEPAPAGEVGGSTMIFVMPMNDVPLIAEP